MIEYSVKAYDPDQEDKLMRAVHADDLCAAVWDIQEMLRLASKDHPESEFRDYAFNLLQRVHEILETTGAAAAMERYK